MLHTAVESHVCAQNAQTWGTHGFAALTGGDARRSIDSVQGWSRPGVEDPGFDQPWLFNDAAAKRTG